MAFPPEPPGRLLGQPFPGSLLRPVQMARVTPRSAATTMQPLTCEGMLHGHPLQGHWQPCRPVLAGAHLWGWGGLRAGSQLRRGPRSLAGTQTGRRAGLALHPSGLLLHAPTPTGHQVPCHFRYKVERGAPLWPAQPRRVIPGPCCLPGALCWELRGEGVQAQLPLPPLPLVARPAASRGRPSRGGVLESNRQSCHFTEHPFIVTQRLASHLLLSFVKYFRSFQSTRCTGHGRCSSQYMSVCTVVTEGEVARGGPGPGGAPGAHVAPLTASGPRYQVSLRPRSHSQVTSKKQARRGQRRCHPCRCPTETIHSGRGRASVGKALLAARRLSCKRLVCVLGGMGGGLWC